MKALPTDDPLVKAGGIRADGRKLHAMHLLRVKSPGRSRQPWDYFDKVRTISAGEAFRPLDQGGCPRPSASLPAASSGRDGRKRTCRPRSTSLSALRHSAPLHDVGHRVFAQRRQEVAKEACQPAFSGQPGATRC
jgi:hypothetical protein